MSTQASDTSVRNSIVVEAPIETAFSVFTEGFGTFKPREHNLLAVEIAETVFETHVGGHIYDRGVDGSECRWARVLAYEPPNRIVFSWDISPRWQIETDLDKTSEVEVRSSPRRRTARASSSSTATSTVTARAGKACATACTATRAGRSTWTGSPSNSRADCVTRDYWSRRAAMRARRGAPASPSRILITAANGTARIAPTTPRSVLAISTATIVVNGESSTAWR